MSTTIPTATWRAQFTPEWRFADAAKLAGYLAQLGISDLYASPIFEARPGSTHGYDITDPRQVREELGGKAAFLDLARTLQQHNLGIILDIVPNHMAADQRNPWWWDVLRRGQSSHYAAFFDIDWSAADGKVILPILGKTPGEAIAAGELALQQEHGVTMLRYFDRRLPLAEGTAGASLDLEHILDRQHYRLMFWRDGLRIINYRRFFDIADLVSLRVESEQVFSETHARIFDFLEAGHIRALRIDHIDGLYDPRQYLERLRDRVPRATGSPPAPGRQPVKTAHDLTPPYVIVEKILADDESLPRDWPVHGTTGYDFLAFSTRLFVDPIGAGLIEADAQQRLSAAPAFEGEARESKRFVIRALFEAETHRLTTLLAQIAAEAGTPIQLEHLREALIETTAAMEVYRTYITDGEPSPEDRRRLRHAVDTAAAYARDTSAPWAPAVDLLRDVLLAPATDRGVERSASAAEGERGADPSEQRPAARGGGLTHSFIRLWQQFTGPAMAKGVEDTALYRRITLASLNDVGCEPDQLTADPIASFHDFCIRRLATPHSLNTTSTHDTKRGEDTRLRISALSTIPHEYLSALDHWFKWHASLRAQLPDGAAPRPADEVLIYQSLLGIWPSEDDPAPAALEQIAARLAQYMTKAAREAKLRSSWHRPDEQYEEALHRFIRGLVLGEEGRGFRDDPQTIAIRNHMIQAGALASLGQIVLKCAAPGIPDFYRGTELWDLSLVDPDNRRPVDFELRQSMLAQLEQRWHDHPGQLLQDLLDDWQSGAIKMFTTMRALAFRRSQAEILQRGDYLPLQITGARASRLIAFARRLEGRWVIALAPRLPVPLTTGLPRNSAWDDAALLLPPEAPATWRSAFAPPQTAPVHASRTPGPPPTPDHLRVTLNDALRWFPVALMEPA